MMIRKCLVEAIDAFWLVFDGCSSAVVADAFPQVGIGLLRAAAAFGLTALTMAYAPVRGCQLILPVIVRLANVGRFPAEGIASYVGAQVIGAILASSGTTVPLLRRAAPSAQELDPLAIAGA